MPTFQQQPLTANMLCNYPVIACHQFSIKMIIEKGNHVEVVSILMNRYCCVIHSFYGTGYFFIKQPYFFNPDFEKGFENVAVRGENGGIFLVAKNVYSLSNTSFHISAKFHFDG